MRKSLLTITIIALVLIASFVVIFKSHMKRAKIEIGELKQKQMSSLILPKAETPIEKPSGESTTNITREPEKEESEASSGDELAKGLKQFQKEIAGVVERAKREEQVADKLSKLKVIDLAMMMYVEDWDGHYPPQRKLSCCLMPYLKDQSLEEIFSDPNFKYYPPPPLDKMKAPAETIAVEWKIFPDVSLILFADGHVRTKRSQ